MTHCFFVSSDRKFGVKARLSQALQVTLSLVKNNINNPKVLQPVLHVLKLYSNNGKNIVFKLRLCHLTSFYWTIC